MRTFLALLLLLPGLAGAASIVAVRITAEGLNIRAHPSAESAVVGYLERGDTVIGTIGNTVGWLLVRSKDGNTGYISARYVELIRVIAVDGDPVPVRPADVAGGGPCGGDEDAELEIAGARFECDDAVLGKGVRECTVAFAVEARSRCTARPAEDSVSTTSKTRARSSTAFEASG